jgi:hypothetical protein
MSLGFQVNPTSWYPNEQSDPLASGLRFVEIGAELWYAYQG